MNVNTPDGARAGARAGRRARLSHDAPAPGRRRALPRDQPQAGQPAALPAPTRAESAARDGDLGPVTAAPAARPHHAGSRRPPRARGGAASGCARVRGGQLLAGAIAPASTLDAMKGRVGRRDRGPRQFALLPRSRARRAFKTFPLIERRAQSRPRRPRARAASRRAREPRARRARDRVEVLPDEAFVYARPPPGAGRPAGGRERHGGRTAVGRHRLAGGGVADDEAGLPRGLRALPQRAVPAGHLAGQGARAGRAPDPVAVRLAALPGAVRRDPARGRAGGARRPPGWWSIAG